MFLISSQFTDVKRNMPASTANTRILALAILVLIMADASSYNPLTLACLGNVNVYLGGRGKHVPR